MKSLLLLALVVATTNVWSIKIITLKVKDKVYTFHDKNGQRVSEECLKKECLALKSKPVETKKESKYTGHPAADYCEGNGGEYVVGVRETGDEDGLCLFKDKSYSLGWDYFKEGKK